MMTPEMRQLIDELRRGLSDLQALLEGMVEPPRPTTQTPPPFSSSDAPILWEDSEWAYLVPSALNRYILLSQRSRIDRMGQMAGVKIKVTDCSTLSGPPTNHKPPTVHNAGRDFDCRYPSYDGQDIFNVETDQGTLDPNFNCPAFYQMTLVYLQEEQNPLVYINGRVRFALLDMAGPNYQLIEKTSAAGGHDDHPHFGKL